MKLQCLWWHDDLGGKCVYPSQNVYTLWLGVVQICIFCQKCPSQQHQNDIFAIWGAISAVFLYSHMSILWRNQEHIVEIKQKGCVKIEENRKWETEI